MMMLNRRKFLAVGSGALALSGLPLAANATLAPMKTFDDNGVDPRLKANCGVYRDGQLVACLNLVGLDTPFSLESEVAQYILNFEASAPVHLAESSYHVSHPKLGDLDLFLQPCGTFSSGQHDGVHYRACMAILK